MRGNTKNKSESVQEEIEKCFVIMPISDQGDYPKGHFTKVYEQIFKPAIEDAEYEPYRVDEDKISNPIINKIFDAVQNCPMALCDLSNRNPNVLYELGLRQAYDKPVVLVQDEKTPRIFDVSGINTVQYSSERLYENVIEARNKITEALISTKKGKENSIVKIVQAETASINMNEFSQEDRMEVMLNSIMSEVKEIRNLAGSIGNITPVLLNSNMKEDQISNNDLRKWEYFSESAKDRVTGWDFLVNLKEGVTMKEIHYVLNKIKDIGMNVRYVRDGRKLRVDTTGECYNTSNVIVHKILSELGEVSMIC